MVSAYVQQEAAKLAEKWGGRIEARPPLFPTLDRLLFGERRYVAGVVAESGDLSIYIRPRRIARLWQRVKTMIVGPRYAGPHDYVVLRYRYAHHRGAYGWQRKWRAFGWVLALSRIRGVAKWRVHRVADEHDPYWREETKPHIARGWGRV